MNFTRKQKYAWKNILTLPDKRKILFDGGARSGKTVILIEYIFARAFQFPGSKQLVARKFRSSAENSVWNETMKDYAARSPANGLLFHLVDSKLKVVFENGSEIIVVGLDDKDRVEKIRGTQYITIYLNEATELSYQTMLDVSSRLSQKVYDASGRMAVPKLLIDCNPRGPRHWLYYVGVRHVDPDTEEPLTDSKIWSRLHWSAYDNKQNLSPEYLAILENYPEIMKQRMLWGKWVANEGQVYSEFQMDSHVIQPFRIPDEWTKLRSIDFGFTNPFVCLWGAIDHDGNLYIYRELYKANTLTSEHAQTIKRLSNNEHFLLTVADHDAEERAELNNAGIHTDAAEKSVQIGIQAVQKRLKDKKLFFFSNLKHLLSEIDSYTWLPPSEERNSKEEPLKLNDHAMDALRYMTMACRKGFEDTIKNKFRRCIT